MKETNLRNNYRYVEVGHYNQKDRLKAVTDVEDGTELKLADSGHKSAENVER